MMHPKHWTIEHGVRRYLRHYPDASPDRAESLIRAMMMRAHGMQWVEIDDVMGWHRNARDGVLRCIDALGVVDEINEMHERRSAEREVRERMTGEAVTCAMPIDQVVAMRHAARVAMTLARYAGASVTGSPPTVARRLELGTVDDARDSLALLDAGEIVRWREWYTPDGMPRWSVGLRAVVR